jgi:hypothetical protein
LKKIFHSQQISIILLLTLALLFSANNADACSCFSPSLKEAVEESANIVILKLQAVEKYQEGENGYGVGGVRQSRLTVEKVFKGNFKIGQSLSFKQGGGGDCVWTFYEKGIGTEYLFFLDAKPDKKNLWEGYICSRSNSLAGAAADLKYLEALSKVNGKTRLSGTLARRDEPAVEGETRSYHRLAGKTVTISGNGKNIKLKTDENGVYEIYDLPPGKYTVTPEKVTGYKSEDADDKDSAEVEIKAKSVTEQDFEFTIDNSIGGRFFDSSGKPLKGVHLDLIPARGNAPPYFYHGKVTDEDGAFEFKKIPIGTYLIVVNKENEISARQPFGTFYYPNKTIREEAAEITIDAGVHLKNLTITAPTTAETVTVSGVLRFEDGKPVSDEAVAFFNNIDDITKIKENEFADSRVTTDENGRFSLRILKGEKGILFGSLYFDKYEKCPKLDSLIRAKRESFRTTETPFILIEADRDLTGIELKFPFPNCPKAKK